MSGRFTVTYHVRAEAADVAARAEAIAVEQSVEMPVAAIRDETVLADIVGVVEGIEPIEHDRYAVRIGLAAATVGQDAGQFLNMVFGNTSLHDDVVLADVAVPASLQGVFGGPRHGIAGLRERLHISRRAMTASALKPQGLPPDGLALLAEHLARGGLDVIKDDHGLADQRYAPYEQRVRACAAAVARGVRSTGHPTRYVPSLTGDLEQMRAQVAVARDAGLDCVMLAPMIAGFPTVQALVRDNPDMLFMAHPSMGGAARIAPDLLIGGLFPLLGADAVVFPNYGGRFGYTLASCRRLAERARRGGVGQSGAGLVDATRPGAGPAAAGQADAALAGAAQALGPGSAQRIGGPALPVPAGGMSLERTHEILDFYGEDTMLLIGGSLLMARENITAATTSFVRAVADHSVG